MPRRRKRVDPALFQLPVEQLREGLYSDTQLRWTRDVLRASERPPCVTLQFSSKQPGYVCGIDEAVAVLRTCVDDWSAVAVHALFDGDRVESWDTVLTVEGPYHLFAHLETPILGALARRTMICTQSRSLVEAARHKSVFLLSARDDLWSAQPGDGHAARTGGVCELATEAQTQLGGQAKVAAVPHALVAACGGDTVAATHAFAAHVPPEVPLLALADYANDCVAASVALVRAFDGRIWGVRLDTSATLVDRSVIPQMGAFAPTGVNAQLVWNVRNALDAEGFGEVRIVASGGITPEKIRAFEEDGVPVDAYGIGSVLYSGRFDFTADVVQVEGKPQARAGRVLRPNAKLERVK